MSRAACLVAAALVGAGLTGCAAAAPTVPPGPSYSQTLLYWTTSMDDYWNSIVQTNPGLIKPDIPFTGFISDIEKRSLLVTACQVRLGLYYKPGRAPTGPGGVDLIYYTCERQFPQDPRTSGYYTPDQLEWLYDFLVHRVAPCVELHGFTVPPTPDRAQFVSPDSYVFYSWSPYDYVPGGPGDAVWDSVYQGCPRLPDDAFQYLQSVLTDGGL